MQKILISLKDPETTERSKSSSMEHIASLGVTSEAPGFPIESALGLEDGPGWRAGEPGEQRIRIVFGEPQDIHRIELEFHETDQERTQEFVLRWAPKEGQALTEIRRQQWNFSPSGSTTEFEDYLLNLSEVRVLELFIRPDISITTKGVASLARCRVN
jgi:hypothetical protein